MSNMISTSTSKLNCLCGAINEPGDLIVPKFFPIEAGLCNCNNCRYATGGLAGISVQLKTSPSSNALAACRRYESTTGAFRYFCGTCGTKLFIYDEEGGRWFALTGAIDRTDDSKDVDTVKITRAAFINQTMDGGLVRRMREVALREDATLQAGITCYAEGRNNDKGLPLVEADSLWSGYSNPSCELSKDDDRVLFSCHCKGVRFHITRPDKHKAYPDRVSRWLRCNNTKYLGLTCACRSCRLATGTPLQPWTYVMPENIFNMQGEAVNFTWTGDALKNLPSVQLHSSSEGCRRSFCQTCGATLFWESSQRADIVDISMGLMRSKRGALADDWIEWEWERTSWKNFCRDVQLARCLAGQDFKVDDC